MAIFDNNFLFESSTDIDVDSVSVDTSVAPTMESIVEMNAELSEGVYRLNSSLYIADLLSEQSGDVSLMEASLEDFWEKTKKRFKEIWEKIKGFFRNLLNKMTAMFQTSENFIKKYEKVITKISSNKNAEYKIFNEGTQTYHLIPKEALKFITGNEYSAGYSNEAGAFIGAITAMDIAVRTSISLKEGKKATEELKDKIKEAEEDVYRKVSNASNAKDCKKMYKAVLTGKSTGVKNVTDKAMIMDMLTYCKTWIASGKKNVMRSQSNMDKFLAAIMKQIDKFKTTQENAAKNNESRMNLVTEAVNAMNRMIGVANYINGASFETFNNCFRTYVGMLKTFVSKNSKLIKKDDVKKESYTDSILDSIMGSF